MMMKPFPARRQARALRLSNEAHNCVRIAVAETDADSAALLIDEALKLSLRARELAR